MRLQHVGFGLTVFALLQFVFFVITHRSQRAGIVESSKLAPFAETAPPLGTVPPSGSPSGPPTSRPTGAPTTLKAFDFGAFSPIVCPTELVQNLSRPRLTQSDLEWCRWSTRDDGGQVKPGKSWGKLAADDQRRFDTLDCNTVYLGGGENPSCDDTWGENLIYKWRQHRAGGGGATRYNATGCNTENTGTDCYEHEVYGSVCIVKNAVIDFSKSEILPLLGRDKGSGLLTRKVKPGFVRSVRVGGDGLFGVGGGPTCKAKRVPGSVSGSGSGSLVDIGGVGDGEGKIRCDVVLNETLVLYSHDEIGIAEGNLGHFMNDALNVHLVLLLSGEARHSRDNAVLLNVDGLRTELFSGDQENHFFSHHWKGFKGVWNGLQFESESESALWHSAHNATRPVPVPVPVPVGGSDPPPRPMTVCARRVVVPNRVPVLFVWEGYSSFDSPCGFVGPSSLLQRWNLQVRRNYGFFGDGAGAGSRAGAVARTMSQSRSLLATANQGSIAPQQVAGQDSKGSKGIRDNGNGNGNGIGNGKDGDTLTVLLVVRHATSNLWGNNRVSRNFLNLGDIVEAIERVLASRVATAAAVTAANTNTKTKTKTKTDTSAPTSTPYPKNITLLVRSLESITPFSAQIALMQRVGIVIGMHGAGITQSLHMPLGKRYCCGVVELFPRGEHFAIRYHGNMVRKLGARYARFELDHKDSTPKGAVVDAEKLAIRVGEMVDSVVARPSCVLPQVLADPFLDADMR